MYRLLQSIAAAEIKMRRLRQSMKQHVSRSPVTKFWLHRESTENMYVRCMREQRKNVSLIAR